MKSEKGETKYHEEQEVFEEVNEQFLLSKRYLDVLHQRFNDQEELYRTYLDPNNYPHGAKVFDPRIFRVIETITPRMVANEPTGSFYPSEDGDVATTHILNSLIKYDWRRAEMFPKLVNFVKSMLIFGTSFGRVYWDFQEREKLQMVPKKLNGRMIWTPKNTKKIKVTDFDGPNFETLNIYDCFPDPNSTNIHNMRWFIYRTFKTLDELKRENDSRGVEYYKNLDKLEEAIASKNAKGKATTDDKQWREHRRVMMGTQEFRGEDKSNEEFVILRRFDKDMWVDIVPEFGCVIREEQNPYFHGELPIVHGVDYPYPGELYGMGEIEPVDRIQRAINAVLNQRLDNVQLTLRNMWKVKKNSGVDLHTLISAPGNIVTTDDMAAVESLQVPDVTGSTFVQTMGYLTSALQNGTGVTDYTVGVGGSNKTVGNTTATGTRLVQQEANAQFKLKVQLLNHMVIQRIANQFKDLRIQYTTEDQKLRIMGPEDIKNLRDNTDLTKINVDGEPIYPGDDRKAKLEIGKGENFAFLHLLPDDIQPSIVGDYDFVAQVSSDQINDPIVLQENFFAALDRVSNPAWIQGLQSQGKQLDYAGATEKVFDKLQIGIEGRSMIQDLPKPEQQPGLDSQQMPEGAITQMAGEPVEDPFTGVPQPEQPDVEALMGGQQNG
jgi:hypothetical protein